MRMQHRQKLKDFRRSGRKEKGEGKELWLAWCCVHVVIFFVAIVQSKGKRDTKYRCHVLLSDGEYPSFLLT